MKGKTVFVGMSGGVDSSVAALRLKKQGYNVVGVFIKVWHPDFLVCNWEQERLDAMRVAAYLEIPFLTCDAEAAYRDEVAEYFISEYLAGRTPNPDVMCNQHVKFGAFIDFAKAHGADFIATGHYAEKREVMGQPELHRGRDTSKDQSYFLYALSKQQLAFSLLPVGDTEKEQIRAEAKAAGLPTAQKKDSQGVCFLGHIDIRDFLSHYTTLEDGAVLDTEGNVIGNHHGALIYTIGQRHGFSVTTHSQDRGVFYVVEKNIRQNTITVSTEKPHLEATNILMLHNLKLRNTLQKGQILEVQTRYRQKPFTAEVLTVETNTLVLRAKETTDAAASGQSCVLYLGSHCLGGGIIA